MPLVEITHSNDSCLFRSNMFITRRLMCTKVAHVQCLSDREKVAGKQRITFLTLSSPVVNICTTCWNVKKNSAIFPTSCIYVLGIIIIINGGCLSKQSQPFGLCSQEAECFLRGKKYIFIPMLCGRISRFILLNEWM